MIWDCPIIGLQHPPSTPVSDTKEKKNLLDQGAGAILLFWLDVREQKIHKMLIINWNCSMWPNMKMNSIFSHLRLKLISAIFEGNEPDLI